MLNSAWREKSYVRDTIYVMRQVRQKLNSRVRGEKKR